MSDRAEPAAGRGQALGRREVLLAGAGGLAAATLAACGEGEENSGDRLPDEPTQEVAALATVLGLERRANGTFESGARFASGREAKQFRDFARQALAHVQVLGQMIEDSGGTAPASEDMDPAFVRDADSATAASKTIANRLIRAYLSAMSLADDGSRRRDLTTMMSNDAQHLVLLGGVGASSARPGGDVDG